jgi:hypothetical protein
MQVAKAKGRLRGKAAEAAEAKPGQAPPGAARPRHSRGHRAASG